MGSAENRVFKLASLSEGQQHEGSGGRGSGGSHKRGTMDELKVSNGVWFDSGTTTATAATTRQSETQAVGTRLRCGAAHGE
jgi:hypothetical protein